LERLADPQRLSGAGFDTAIGTINEKLVVVATPASQPAEFSRIVSALRNAYQPGLVLGAGFSISSDTDVPVGASIVASRVVLDRGDGAARSFQMSGADAAGASHLVGTVAQGHLSRLDEPILATNDWCFRFAQACSDHEAPAAAATIVNQMQDEAMDDEVRNVLDQPSTAGRAGALLRAVWQRPASVFDLARRKSRQWEHQEKLADLVESLLAAL